MRDESLILMFNFSKNYQISTDVKLKEEKIETINSSDLRRNENTKLIVNKHCESSCELLRFPVQ